MRVFLGGILTHTGDAILMHNTQHYSVSPGDVNQYTGRKITSFGALFPDQNHHDFMELSI